MKELKYMDDISKLADKYTEAEALSRHITPHGVSYYFFATIVLLSIILEVYAIFFILKKILLPVVIKFIKPKTKPYV